MSLNQNSTGSRPLYSPPLPDITTMTTTSMLSIVRTRRQLLQSSEAAPAAAATAAIEKPQGGSWSRVLQLLVLLLVLAVAVAARSGPELGFAFRCRWRRFVVVAVVFAIVARCFKFVRCCCCCCCC